MKKYIGIGLLILLIVWLSWDYCCVSDKEAIVSAKAFCNKFGIQYSFEPKIHSSNKNSKKVIIKDFGAHQQYFTVNCAKEIISFRDMALNERVFRKYNIPTNNIKPRKWPPLLSESRAKEIIVSYASKIGLPPDVEFLNMYLDLDHDGTWIGFWKRTLNGYPYEYDSFSVAIMAIDGELFSYGKRFLGKPCPTEVKVTKEEAVAKGWKKLSKYFDSEKWDKLKNEYKVESAELMIVQPNTFLGFVVPWKSNKSRLAWVIKYAVTNKPEFNKRVEIGFHDRFVIKIDAATRSFLGGETGKYK